MTYWETVQKHRQSDTFQFGIPFRMFLHDKQKCLRQTCGKFATQVNFLNRKHNCLPQFICLIDWQYDLVESSQDCNQTSALFGRLCALDQADQYLTLMSAFPPP